jgi:hypothetical protein
MQRLILAGFHDPRVAINMFAVIEGESGSYTKAWHANVKRLDDENKSIVRDAQGRMFVKSVDLGFIQRNLVMAGGGVWMPMEEDAMSEFIETLFNENPDLAVADKSAIIAYELFSTRGFQPWYAYQPGTVKWQHKKRIASKALAEYLLRTQVGKIDGVLPELVWKQKW